jgi:hypothetical protein
MPRQHGNSIITVEGEIIIIKVIGCFNIEGITESIQHLKSTIKSFYQRQFKLLLNYLEVEGGTPEVFEIINQFNIWLNTQNIVAKAIVTDSLINLAILKKRAPASQTNNSKVFKNQSNAFNWLRSQHLAIS